MSSVVVNPVNGPAQVVFGVPISDAGAAALAKKVFNLAGFLVVLNLINLIITLGDNAITSTEGLNGIVSFLIGLSLPACGIMGAKNKNERLLCAVRY